MDYGLIRGTGVANGNATLSSGTTNLMKLSIGGNGPATGETMTVNGTGNLSVYDTIVVGDQNNASLNIAAGTVSAYNVILGNTVYSPTAVDNIGTINFSGGTLNLSQLVLGAGSVGAWTAWRIDDLERRYSEGRWYPERERADRPWQRRRHGRH